VENLPEQATLVGDLFRLTLPTEGVIVTITLRQDKLKRLLLNCDSCDGPCVHWGTALSCILESKVALGLARAPDERKPVEALSEAQLIERAMAERQQRAIDEKMSVEAVNKAATTPWGEYVVTSKLSGKSYRVSLGGTEPEDSFCTCPDYRTNTLGTCKHILHALNKLKRRFDASAFRRKPKPKETSVYLKYGIDLALRLAVPHKVDESIARIVGPIRDVDISDVNDLVRRIDKLEGLGEPVVVHPDAEEFIQHQLYRQRIKSLVEEIRRDPAKHVFRTTLLKTELLPYQMDGIAFAAGAGRAILADDMGLGRTAGA
jgi:hypothetical protein